jgi:CelD/BcsL family acetyltransferase involved in cellulose biosynthesis
MDLPESNSKTTRLRHEVRRIAALDAFIALRPAWNELTRATQAHLLCMTYDYCELAARTAFNNAEAIDVVMVYCDRDLLAIWPFAIERRGLLRVAKALTCGSNEEYGGPLVKEQPNGAMNGSTHGSVQGSIHSALVDALRELDADLLEVRFVRHGSELQKSLALAPQSWLLRLLPSRWRGGLPAYSIEMRDFSDWDAFAATLPKSLRAILRTSLRRLGERGHVELDWCKTLDDAHTVLTWLFANKRRWAKSHGFDTPYLMDDRARDFFMALARQTDLANIPLVAFVKVDGVPVAAALSLAGSRLFEYFVISYDPEFGRYSVGNLLSGFLVKWAYDHGLDFDFRPFYADYKARWSNCRSWHETYTIVLSARGRLWEFSVVGTQIARVKRKLNALTRAKMQAWRDRFKTRSNDTATESNAR